MIRLSNKQTGEIGELHYNEGKEYRFTVVAKDPTQTRIYKTLGEVLKDWKDFIVRVPDDEPLAKDPKARKNEQFESLKRVFVKQIKENGYTKTTADFKKHCDKLKQALKDARYEVSVEKRRIHNREYQQKYHAKKKAEGNKRNSLIVELPKGEE